MVAHADEAKKRLREEGKSGISNALSSACLFLPASSCVTRCLVNSTIQPSLYSKQSALAEFSNVSLW